MWISTRTFRWADGPRMNLSHRGCNPATIAGLGNDNLTYHQTCDFSQLGYAHGIAMPYTTSFCTKATSLYITLHHRTFIQSLTVINPQREIEYIYIASRCTAFHCEFLFIALSIQVCSAHSIPIYIWLVVWNMAFIFPLENIWDSHPNWRTPSFFRGVGIPPTRLLSTIINHIIPYINHTLASAPCDTWDPGHDPGDPDPWRGESQEERSTIGALIDAAESVMFFF